MTELAYWLRESIGTENALMLVGMAALSCVGMVILGGHRLWVALTRNRAARIKRARAFRDETNPYRSPDIDPLGFNDRDTETVGLDSLAASRSRHTV